MLRSRLLLILFVGFCGLQLVHAQAQQEPADDPFGDQPVQILPVAPVKKSEGTKKAVPADVVEKSAAAKDNGPLQFSTKLIDDSQLKIEITEPTITIATKYGTLAIPTAEIKRLEIGLRYPAGMEAKIDAAISDLGSEAFHLRDAAEKKILAYQELALPAIRTATKSSDKEISSRANRMLDSLQSSLPEEKFQRKTSDIIVTEEFTARGKIELNELQIRSKIFGPAKLALHEIRDARSITRDNNSQVTIDAGQYGKANRSEWLDTGIDIETDNSLQIDASGQVDLLPQSPGQMLCGPTGQPGNSMSFRNPNGTTLRTSSGALIGRIGTNGLVFTIGARYKAPRSGTDGRLYLQIAPGPNGDVTGSYTAKVTQGD